MRRVSSLETLVARRPSLKEGLSASISGHRAFPRSRERYRDPGIPRSSSVPRRERECVERADEEGSVGEEGAIGIGPTAIAACRSTGRSRTIAWRATRASYAYRSPFAKSARAPSPPPSPPSRSRRTVIVSVSSDRCRKRRARRASLGMPPIVARPPSVVGRRRCSSRRCVRTLGRLE